MFLSIRRDNRFFDIHSSDYYMHHANINEKALTNSNFQFHNEIKTLFENLFNNESSIDTKTNCLIILNNSIQSSNRLLIPYLTVDNISSIFNLVPIMPHICCSVYRFFTNLMKMYPKNFYSVFIQLNIFKITIDIINPEIESFSYHQILLFLCETIQQVPISTHHLIQCGIIPKLSEMNPNENVDQLLIIYSSILMVNNVNDYSSISKVFDYLSKGKITTIISALYYIQKCLQKHENDFIWKFAVFDARLTFLLESFSAYIVSDVVYCYNLICVYGDEAISMLINEGTILRKIVSFIFYSDAIASPFPNIQRNLTDGHIAALASLDFMVSMVSHANDGKIIEGIFNIVITLNFPNIISLFNYPCKEKICQIVLKLLCKINHSQAKLLFNPEFFDIIAQVMVNNEESIEHFDLMLTYSKERFIVDEEFVSLIDDIQRKYCVYI